jgi:hypothetical protein
MCHQLSATILYVNPKCWLEKPGSGAAQNITLLFYIVQNQKQKCLIQALVIALR